MYLKGGNVMLRTGDRFRTVVNPGKESEFVFLGVGIDGNKPYIGLYNCTEQCAARIEQGVFVNWISERKLCVLDERKYF